MLDPRKSIATRYFLSSIFSSFLFPPLFLLLSTLPHRSLLVHSLISICPRPFRILPSSLSRSSFSSKFILLFLFLLSHFPLLCPNLSFFRIFPFPSSYLFPSPLPLPTPFLYLHPSPPFLPYPSHPSFLLQYSSINPFSFSALSFLLSHFLLSHFPPSFHLLPFPPNLSHSISLLVSLFPFPTSCSFRPTSLSIF